MAPPPDLPPRKILLLVNPAAGHGSAGRLAASVAEFLRRRGVCVGVCTAATFEKASERAALAAGEFECVAAVGGDGTVNAVLTGLFGTGAVLGILPAGNGNDIARGLHLPRDFFAAARALIRYPPKRVDALRACFADGSVRLYLGAGGVGLDSEAARLAQEQFNRVRGTPRYLAAALWALRNYRPMEVRLETESGILGGARTKALLLTAANGPCYGGGVRIAPQADMCDGQLDLVLVELLDWPRIVQALPVLLRHGDLRYPEVHRFRTCRVRITTHPPAVFHGDGELLGRTPVEVTVLPRAVPVIAPPKSAAAKI
jgi:YegS/Rv2252/BmrU family lipid kinase